MWGVKGFTNHTLYNIITCKKMINRALKSFHTYKPINVYRNSCGNDAILVHRTG